MVAQTTVPQHLEALANAADRLGVSEKTLRRWIAEGRLTAWRLGPKLIRLDRDEIDALLRPIPTAGGAA